MSTHITFPYLGGDWPQWCSEPSAHGFSQGLWIPWLLDYLPLVSQLLGVPAVLPLGELTALVVLTTWPLPSYSLCSVISGPLGAPWSRSYLSVACGSGVPPSILLSSHQQTMFSLPSDGLVLRS